MKHTVNKINLEEKWHLYRSVIDKNLIVQSIKETERLEALCVNSQLEYREQISVLDDKISLIERIQPFLKNSFFLKKIIDFSVNYVCLKNKIIKPDIYFSDKLVLKPPGCPGYILHKDSNYWQAKLGYAACTVGVSLDSSSIESGPLMMESQNSLKEEYITLDLKAGDIIFFGGMVSHWSGPNVSQKYRRMIYVSFYTKKI